LAALEITVTTRVKRVFRPISMRMTRGKLFCPLTQSVEARADRRRNQGGMLQCSDCSAVRYERNCRLHFEEVRAQRFGCAIARKIIRYLETMRSAGNRDEQQLTTFGLAYLEQLFNTAPRYSGC
jgi:hypothetical protein